MTLRITPSVEIPESELAFQAARAGGPGGQHVNKVATKIVLRFSVQESQALTEGQKDRVLARVPARFLTKDGELVISADEHRDQSRNRERCLEKLREVLAQALAKQKRRIPTKAGKGVKRRRKEAKQRQSQKKQGRRERFDS